ncbi:MAG: VanZ family protein [Bacteroidales bacterium]
MAQSPLNIHFARNNLLFYSLLLIITPFLMLQNYLQDAIGLLSAWSLNLGSVKIPYILIAFFILLISLIIRFRNGFTKKRILAWLAILLMWIVAQNIADYYLNLPFYQLQNNWHYFAYGIFAFLAYQYYSGKNTNPAHLIIRIFFTAMAISTFDEIMQGFISSRVFDISDIAKDLWGVLMGIIFLFFVYADVALFKKGKRIREKKLKDYLSNPLAMLVYMLLFTFILLNVSSTLSDAGYGFVTVGITSGIFLIIFLLIHITREKTEKIVIGSILGVLVIILGISVSSNFNRNITQCNPGMVVYKGVPIPYFDFMIFENGCFRPVDKKTHFNHPDINFFFTKASKILLIGSGQDAIPRMGFREDLTSQFIYNEVTGEPLQVIILPTGEACKVFNRLKREKKEVVFIVHNAKTREVES